MKEGEDWVAVTLQECWDILDAIPDRKPCRLCQDRGYMRSASQKIDGVVRNSYWICKAPGCMLDILKEHFPSKRLYVVD